MPYVTKINMPDKKSGRRSVLSFDDTGHVSRLIHEAAGFSEETATEAIRRGTDANSDNDPSEDTAESAAEAAGRTFGMAKTLCPPDGNRMYGEDPGAGKGIRDAEIPNEGGYRSNPNSRSHQKRSVKREYAAAGKRGRKGRAVKAADRSARAAGKSEDGSRRAAGFISRHRKGLLLAGGILAIVLVSFSAVSSCSVMFEGMGSVIAATTYPVEDADIYAAEEMYREMEDGLRGYADSFERNRSADEYRYEIDEPGHDPYVLISAVTAIEGGHWTSDDISDTLALLYSHQYRVTVTEKTETRYRNETVSDVYWINDPGTGERRPVPYVYTVNIAYDWHICTLKIVNIGLTSVPDDVMTSDQLSVFEMYMATLGNRSDLFPQSKYVKNRKQRGE